MGGCAFESFDGCWTSDLVAAVADGRNLHGLGPSILLRLDNAESGGRGQTAASDESDDAANE